MLDLGSGTGSNLRYLARRLPGEQEWTLVDRDAALLDQATGAAVAVAGVARVKCVPGELDRAGLGLVPEADLVTASALLDLVTHEWLEQLVATCRAAGNAALLTLTWDGTMTWDDPDPDDALVAEAVRIHQLRDKGMGPALGPAAGPAAERAFRVAGYHTWLRAEPLAPGRRRRFAGSRADRRVGGSCFGAAPRGRPAHPGLGGAPARHGRPGVRARGGTRGSAWPSPRAQALRDPRPPPYRGEPRSRPHTGSWCCRRTFREPLSCSAQVEIEEEVVSQGYVTAPSAQRLVRGLNRRKGDPRTARAHQHRRDGQGILAAGEGPTFPCVPGPLKARTNQSRKASIRSAPSPEAGMAPWVNPHSRNGLTRVESPLMTCIGTARLAFSPVIRGAGW